MTEATGAVQETTPVACSDDAFLGGSLRILQPCEGYRAGIDPVFLAAAVEAAPGTAVLEAGAGVGVAGLCLARRLAEARVTGLDVQSTLVDIARLNARRNDLEARVEFVQGDILRPPRALAARRFDQVMINPPFYDQSERVRAARAPKRLSHMGDGAALDDWLSFCLTMLKPKGALTLVHRPDRLGDILRCLEGRAGGVRVFPLWPRAGAPARRIVVKAVKGSAGPLSVLPGLALHETGHWFTSGAEAVLRHGAGLPF